MKVHQKPRLLLVGTGHWSNPGKDLIAVTFDDMLSPRRQAEIAECLERLKAFAPTKVLLKVLLEVSTRDQEGLDADYTAYLRGDLELSANERYQLGFRLADKMGHKRIYGVDWHDLERPILWLEAFEFAKSHGQQEWIGGHQDETELKAKAAEEEAWIARSSVSELLIGGNDPGKVAQSHTFYSDLAQVGEGENYIGADVVLRWYERNLKIFTNIRRVVTSPGDRLLLVIGGGHLPLLNHFAEASGVFELAAVTDYL